MTQNYYSVTLEFGHVGRNSYVLKTVPIIAENGKEAAYRARWMGRAKHDKKDLIKEVTKISKELYDILLAEKQNDAYFRVHSKQEQTIMCNGLMDQVVHYKNEVDDEERKINRKNKLAFQAKRNKSYKKYCNFMIKNYELCLA